MSGDVVRFYDNHVFRVGEGTTVEGVTIEPNNHTTVGGGHLIVDGGTIRNSQIHLGWPQGGGQTPGHPISTLELRSGTIDNSNWAMTNKYSTAIKISGGEMTVKSLVQNNSHVQTLEMTGGTLNVLEKQIGIYGGTTFRLNGGKLNMGYKLMTWGVGKAEVEIDGTEMPAGMTYTVPQDTGGDGALRIRNMTNEVKAIQIASGGNEHRTYMTGEVWVADSVLTNYSGSMLTMGNDSHKRTNGVARLTLDNSTIAQGAALGIAPNATWRNSYAYLTLTNGSSLIFAKTTNPDEVTYAGGAGNFNIGDGARVELHGSGLYVPDRLFLGKNGQLTVGEGGVVKAYRVFSEAGNTAGFVFRQKGGTVWMAERTLQLGGDNNSLAQTWNSVGVTYLMSGGKIDANWIVVNRGSTNHVARFEYSGGELGDNIGVCFGGLPHNESNNPLYPATVARGEFAIRGARGEPRVKSISANDMQGTYLNERILDLSPGHISPLKIAGTSPQLNGILRVRLDGGVLVCREPKFTVTEAVNATKTFAAGDTYDGEPDAGMWTVGMSEDLRKSHVELSDAAKKSVDGKGSTGALAEPCAKGAVKLPTYTKKILKEYAVDLEIEPQGGNTLEGLAERMRAAGYTNTVVAADAESTVRVVVPPDALPERREASAVWFLWDFTRDGGIKAPDAVTVDAAVKSVTLKADVVKGFMLMVR